MWASLLYMTQAATSPAEQVISEYVDALVEWEQENPGSEPPYPGWNCDDPMQQQEMNWCAQQDFVKADAALNAQWQATAAQMKHREMMYDHSHESRPGYFEVLLAAQRAWLAYRDQHCATEGYLARGGSLEPLLVATCKTALTKERTQQLYDIEVWPE